MSQSVAQSLEVLRALGTPQEMREQADRRCALQPRPGVNAHVHLPPNFSAFVSVEQVVDLASSQGVGVIGASNYYDYEVYGELARLAHGRGIFPLFGLEIICMIDDLRQGGVKINDPANPGKMYICGKGITRFAASNMTPQARELLDVIRRNDSQRMDAMVRRLEQVFAAKTLSTGLDTDSVIDMIVRRHSSPRSSVYLQERHVCQAFQEAFFAQVPSASRIERFTALAGAAPKVKGPEDFVGFQNEIRSHLMKAGKPGYVEETFVDFDHARRLILALGGYPVYPVLADGVTPLCGFEEPPQKLVQNIQRRGILAAELIPIRNTPEVLRDYVLTLRAAGLAVTAGTEHNTLDLIPIDPTCKGGQPVADDLRAIFWEGACVAAAHQFLSLHGQVGMVDAQGQPNPQYPHAEARLAGLARLGEAVLARYRGGQA